jgi:hypothetical protein
MDSRTKALLTTLAAMGAGVLLGSGAARATPGVEDAEIDSAHDRTRAQLIHATATIAGIDNTDRSVLLKVDDGSQLWLHVPDSVDTFDRLKMGDKVHVAFYQSLAISLAPSDARPSMSATKTGEVDLAAGVRSREFKFAAKVVSVDTAAETVTFRGPQGRLATIDVQGPTLRAKLPTLKPGQVVQFDYTEAVAADIQRISR